MIPSPSPSPSLIIQIMGGKVCLRCKGKILLGFVNKLLKIKSLLTMPSNVFCHYTSSKLSRPYFEFLLKVKVMRSNAGYLLKSFLIYTEIPLPVMKSYFRSFVRSYTNFLTCSFSNKKVVFRLSFIISRLCFVQYTNLKMANG